MHHIDVVFHNNGNVRPSSNWERLNAKFNTHYEFWPKFLDRTLYVLPNVTKLHIAEDKMTKICRNIVTEHDLG